MWDDEDLESPRRLDPFRRPLVQSLILGDLGRQFDPTSKSVRPLFSVKVTSKAVTVTFDLPYVDRKGIGLTSTGSALDVDAKLRRPTTVRVGWTVQKRVRLERYKAHVELPTSINPEGAKATFKNGLLSVRIPVAGSGTKVKVR